MSTVLDKRRERKQIPRNLVLRSKGYVQNKCGECNQKSKETRNSIPIPNGRSSNKTWIIVIPSILYGAEVFDMAEKNKRKLKIIERQVGRWVIRETG